MPRPVKAVSERKAARPELCRLLTDYSTAEAAWLRFVDDMARCGLSKERIEQIRNAHMVRRRPTSDCAPPPKTASRSYTTRKTAHHGAGNICESPRDDRHDTQT